MPGARPCSIEGQDRHACGPQLNIITVWLRSRCLHSPARAGSAFRSHCKCRLVLWIGLGHYGVEAVLKPESFPIDKIYVPVKRRKSLRSEMVQEIAESILEIGQQAPVLIRPDEDRFVLVEGLHRLEACKALGEKTIIGLLVSAEV